MAGLNHKGLKASMKLIGPEPRVPPRFKEDEFNLGTWISRQRKIKDNLSQDQIDRLESLGFVWDPLSEAWENGFIMLQRFQEQEGHCRVPTNRKEDDFNFGAWISTQRKNKDSLSPDRIKRLDALGFVWKAN